MENTQHEESTFATLTYTEDALAFVKGVTPRSVSLFLKRLRKATGRKLRYFAVGEYGAESGRPHYHLALFGYPNCERGRTRPSTRTGCCVQCDMVSKAWGYGNIMLTGIGPESAGYLAGYIAKKYGKKTAAPEGYPEFARMSLKPGIGIGYLHDVASELLKAEKEGAIIEDVPLSLGHGNKKYPLGRYLRRNLRKMIGRDEKAPQSVLAQQKAELQLLRQTAFENSTPLSKEIQKTLKQKHRNLYGRTKIYAQKRNTI